MRIVIWSVLAALAACGGGKKPVTTPQDDDRPEVRDGSENMVSQETMDEIRRLLDRKRTSVSRCITVAIEEKEVPKNAKAKVLLKVVISPAGHADSVDIVNTSVDAKTMLECVKNNVRQIEFPHVPKAYETSYTYSFESS